jgi:RNA polymerase sigma-70 factor (ECF subfamily)
LESSAKAFLYISTRNACINFLQQAQYQARVRNSLRYLLDDSCDYVLNEITRAEVLRTIYMLVEKLPPQCRKIILLSFSTGLSNRQIADMLHLSVHTVRNQKVRGIELVRKRLECMESKQ